jgi:hypothetical protein
LRLRARIEEFELATKNAGHGWEVFDLTDTFARWLASGRYAEKWFKQPQLIASILPKYQDYLVAQFRDFLAQRNPSDNDAVALTGVGSLFGFVKVRDVVEKLSGLVHGRLVVFFPGSFEDNNYRLLDGYDGWNYLATPLPPTKRPNVAGTLRVTPGGRSGTRSLPTTLKDTNAMKNREIYIQDPSTRKLVNEGVANVNDDQSDEAMEVLRYELETFVCDGQYAKALVMILEAFLKNIQQAQQAAVWIAGFFGSGKSHLVKMLRALWVDIVFRDGATARSIAVLPKDPRSAEGTVHAGQTPRRTACRFGHLGAGASGSVRLALLRIVFKSVGLPEQYPLARFVMWLRHEGIYDQVRQRVESTGYDWQEELDNFYVAEGLHEALVHVKPKLFSSVSACVETLNNLYPFVQDVSSDEMVKAIRQALTVDGKFPLTLIVLDEIQQFIGTDTQRSIEVQEVVEACCKTSAASCCSSAPARPR